MSSNNNRVVCLAHGLDGKPNGCPLSMECAAHRAIAQGVTAPVVGRICGEFPETTDGEDNGSAD